MVTRLGRKVSSLYSLVMIYIPSAYLYCLYGKILQDKVYKLFPVCRATLHFLLKIIVT